MKIAFFDEKQRPVFKGGSVVIATPEQLESREWAPLQPAFFPKANVCTVTSEAGGGIVNIPEGQGDVVLVKKLDQSGACDASVLALAKPGQLIIIKDWAGKDHLTLSVTE